MHLEMSNALRRDIFDLENVRGFAEKIGSPSLLKMLTLLTYADIKAVNPEALTPWKAENLWQLYMATANFMDRSVDEIRYHAAIDPTLLNRLRSMVPMSQYDALGQFLEGLPQRYLQTRLPEHIRNHFQLAARLDQDPVQLDLRPTRQLFDLTVIARDRSRLFADVAGALAAWGMNIVKAGAFSNEAGVIVDSFQFSDVFRTLELNPSEKERFLEYLHDVVAQKSPGGTDAGSAPPREPQRQHQGRSANAAQLRHRIVDTFDAVAGGGAGRPRPSSPGRSGAEQSSVQHRGRPDRHGRRDRDRRLLPDQRRGQARARNPAIAR